MTENKISGKNFEADIRPNVAQGQTAKAGHIELTAARNLNRGESIKFQQAADCLEQAARNPGSTHVRNAGLKMLSEIGEVVEIHGAYAQGDHAQVKMGIADTQTGFRVEKSAQASNRKMSGWKVDGRSAKAGITNDPAQAGKFRAEIAKDMARAELTKPVYESGWVNRILGKQVVAHDFEKIDERAREIKEELDRRAKKSCWEVQERVAEKAAPGLSKSRIQTVEHIKILQEAALKDAHAHHAELARMADQRVTVNTYRNGGTETVQGRGGSSRPNSGSGLSGLLSGLAYAFNGPSSSITYNPVQYASDLRSIEEHGDAGMKLNAGIGGPRVEYSIGGKSVSQAKFTERTGRN